MTLPEHLQVHAIVPFSGYGSDEILALPSSDGFRLPAGSPRPGERVLEAASRIVLESTGVPVEPQRLVYVVETLQDGMLFGVLCEPGDLDDVEGDVQGEIVSLGNILDVFEPMAIAEVLMEDLRSGFVRPVAHVVERIEHDKPVVSVTW